MSDAAQEMLRSTTELDYMTHIVFRMYENKRCVRLPLFHSRRVSVSSRGYGNMLLEYAA